MPEEELPADVIRHIKVHAVAAGAAVVGGGGNTGVCDDDDDGVDGGKGAASTGFNFEVMKSIHQSF